MLQFTGRKPGSLPAHPSVDQRRLGARAQGVLKPYQRVTWLSAFLGCANFFRRTEGGSHVPPTIQFL